MPKVPASFYKFQSLVMESSVLDEVGDSDLTPRPASADGSDKPKGPVGELATREKSLSFLCDGILSSLHAEDNFRDAIIDSRANIKDGSILLLINSEFEQLEELLSFIQGLEHVESVGYGTKKDPSTQDEITAIKIKGHGTDCNPTDDNRADGDKSTVSKPVTQPITATMPTAT